MPHNEKPKALTLPDAGSGSAEWWKNQLDRAKKERDKLKEVRRDLVSRYRDTVKAMDPGAIRVPIEYEKTEQKRHQLFFRVPSLRLKPHPRTQRMSEQAEEQAAQQAAQQDPNQPQQAPESMDLQTSVGVFREVLQRHAGPRGMNTKKLMDTNIFDVICPAGIAACVVGYEQFTKGEVPVPTGEQRPMTPEEIEDLPVEELQAASAAGQPLTVPETKLVPNVVYWRLFASRISPGKLLVPADFIGNDYSNQANWLAFDITVPMHVAKARKWELPKEVATAPARDEDLLVDQEGADESSSTDMVKAVEVWCYPQRIYDDVAHPLQIRRLIFVDGVDAPVLIQDERHQEFAPNGSFVRGITSLPVKILTLRYASDTWCPPSDCWITRRQANELSEARSQMIKHRKKAVPMRWIDINRVPDPRVRRLIIAGEYYDTIPTDGPGGDHMGEIAQAQFPRDNFQFNDYIMSDIDRAWALGGNQQGVSEATARTATELSLIQQATENRLTGEKGAVTDYWLSIMETASKLIQLYAREEDYVEIVGEDGAKKIQAWTKTDIQGEFLFDIVPDSGDRPDAAHERELALNKHNLMANDPHVNGKRLTETTLRAFGEDDPSRLTQDPVEPGPEPPRFSIAIRSESLHPQAPELPNVMLLLADRGMDISGIDQQDAPNPDAVDDGGPIHGAEVIDRGALQTGGSSVDNRQGGLTDAGAS